MIGSVVVLSHRKPLHTFTGDWFRNHGYSDAIYVLSPGDNIRVYEEVTGCRCVISESTSLPTKREWALNNLTRRGNPWLVIFEDNIKRVTGVDAENWDRTRIDKTTRAMYHDTEFSPQEVIKVMHDDMYRCYTQNTGLGGYASNDNHFFRKTKYRQVGFVWGKMCFMHRGLPQVTDIPAKCDYAFTASALETYGSVHLNNWLYPWKGGPPTIAEREQVNREATKYLLKHYPNMFRVKDRKGFPPETEVQLRFTSVKQVHKWRIENDR